MEKVDSQIKLFLIIRSTFLNARKVLLIQWLIWANILSHAYKGVLLSMLSTITYHGPIDTLEQADQSGIPFFIPDVATFMVATDPRSVVQSLQSKGVVIEFKDVFIEETNQR